MSPKLAASLKRLSSLLHEQNINYVSLIYFTFFSFKNNWATAPIIVPIKNIIVFEFYSFLIKNKLQI